MVNPTLCYPLTGLLGLRFILRLGFLGGGSRRKELLAFGFWLLAFYCTKQAPIITCDVLWPLLQKPHRIYK